MRSAPFRSLTVGSLAASLTFLAAPRLVRAQGAADFEPAIAAESAFPLTIRSIMRGPELLGQSPQGVRWSDDGEWVYFRWLPGGNDWYAERVLYRVRASGGEPELVDETEEADLGPTLASGDVSSDGRWRAVSSAGDLWLIERATGAARRLTRTTASESGATFSGDDASIYFRRDRDLFAFDISSGAIRQLTRIAAGPAEPDEPDVEGQKAFLEEQQRELFEHVRIDELREERREARAERARAREPETVHLAQGERVRSLSADPTGRHVIVTAVRGASNSTRTDIPRWITGSGYTENTEMRSKVGDAQSSSRLGLLDTETGAIEWLDLSGEDESGEAERGEAGGGEGERGGGGEHEGGEDAGEDDAPPPSPAIASFVGWDETGTHGLVFAMDSDYKTARLYSLSASTGELTLLDSLHDEAWIGGPCFGFGGAGCMGWLPATAAGDTPRAFYVSEETGWSHVYAIDADGTHRQALTAGEWEVRGVEIPDGWDAFLMHTSEVSAFDRHPWRMDFDGSDRVQLLEGEGSFQATPSPDGQRFAVIHSRSNHPPELYLSDVRPGASLDPVTESPTEEWRSFEWLSPEIVHIEARDGVQVPARIYRPSDFGVPSNGAGVVFVHGAGYLQNVHHAWSSYFREYMFHHFLAAQGYTVLDIDYRGSAGYGRDWRTAIYRHMGGWDLSDQVDGAAYLAAEEGVDPHRLGIYGGSYGGFITLMALFTEPGVFEAGAALRAVTDWAHYNHPYTSRILNLPSEDEEAYEQSSPIYFAEGLEGHLLMAHGMYDTNVHFSDVVRLAQRLIELGKENWEMAVYPVENHGFVEPASWTDEYRRIYALFERVVGSGVAALAGEGG